MSAPTTAKSESAPSFPVPTQQCLEHATKLAVTDERPIMLDYWLPSLEKKVLIGVKESGEKLLVKSAEEYTSPIEKVFKLPNEFIILTENSLYIVSSGISIKRIS
jgi:hypothetical protein